ncbi:LOW QUALITY PROTEIN: neuropeptides capa receptor-like [Amphiura filiformis]|uniref:LOW QUALITY PROTEIN: neuropeptides capa receptor-like n=1 Tax=Amphiura filiformis TaxID=82378 RepID=UPI003B21E292
MNCSDVNNLSVVEKAETAFYSKTERLFITTIMPCVLVIGFLGNVAFLIAVARIPRMRTITNVYLVQVAVCDAFFITVSTSSYMWHYNASPLRFDVAFQSWVGCFASIFPLLLTYTASLLLLTSVTAERFYAICYPLKLRVIADKKRNTKIVCIIWITSFIIASYGVLRFSNLHIQCIIWPSDEKPYSSYPKIRKMCLAVHPIIPVSSEIVQTLPFFLVFPINFYMYSRIVYTLGNRMQTSDDHETRMSGNPNKVRNQVARLLIINGLVFFICQSPSRLADLHYIIRHLTGAELFSPAFYGSLVIIGRTLVFINATCNPLIYIGCSPFYRKAIWEGITSLNVQDKRNIFSLPLSLSLSRHAAKINK